MTSRTRIILVAVLTLVLCSGVSLAGDGKWRFGARIINISPDEGGDSIPDVGGTVGVDAQTTLEVDLTYFFTKNLGLEVIAATAQHELKAEGGDLAGANLGKVRHIPPTFTLKYFFNPEAKFRPYVGIGLNYTIFPDYKLSSDLAGLGVTDIDFDNSFGLAGNVGADVMVNDNWAINFDVKYIQISTTVDLQVPDVDVPSFDVDINPWVFGVGVGYRF